MEEAHQNADNQINIKGGYMVIKRYSMLLLFVFVTASIFGQSNSQTESFDFRREFEGYVDRYKNSLNKFLKKNPSSSFEINKTDFPKLFAMISRLAETISVHMPKSIIVSFDEDCWAYTSLLTMKNGKSERRIGIGKNLFRNCSDAQIEAVTAHELAHIALGHGEERLAINKGAKPAAGLISIVTFTFAAFRAESVMRSSCSAFLAAVVSYYGIKLLNASFFSRAREKEADLTAAKILGRGKDLISALRVISRDDREFSWLEELFSTHPSTQERIQYIQAAMVNRR